MLLLLVCCKAETQRRSATKCSAASAALTSCFDDSSRMRIGWSDFCSNTLTVVACLLVFFSVLLELLVHAQAQNVLSLLPRNVSTHAPIGESSGSITVLYDSHRRVLYVTIANRGIVMKLTANGTATNLTTSIATPWGMALQEGGAFMFLSNSPGHRLFNVSTDDGAWQSYCGGASPGSTDGHCSSIALFDTPRALAFRFLGTELLVAEAFGSLRKLTFVGPADAIVATVANGFGQVFGLAVDALGNAYVSDRISHVVWRVDATSNAVTPLAGLFQTNGHADGLGTVARFDFPTAIVYHPTAECLLVTEEQAGRVRAVTLTGTVFALVGNPNRSYVDAFGTHAQFRNLYGVAVDDVTNELYVPDGHNSCIRRVSGALRRNATRATDSRSMSEAAVSASMSFSQVAATGSPTSLGSSLSATAVSHSPSDSFQKSLSNTASGTLQRSTVTVSFSSLTVSLATPTVASASYSSSENTSCATCSDSSLSVASHSPSVSLFGRTPSTSRSSLQTETMCGPESPVLCGFYAMPTVDTSTATTDTVAVLLPAEEDIMYSQPLPHSVAAVVVGLSLKFRLSCRCHQRPTHIAANGSVSITESSYTSERAVVVTVAPRVNSSANDTSALLLGGDMSWIQIRLENRDDIWLPASRRHRYSAATYLRITLWVFFASGSHQEVLLIVPVLPLPPPSIVRVAEAVTTSAQWASLGSPPSSALSLGRLVVSRVLTACVAGGSDASVEGMFPFVTVGTNDRILSEATKSNLNVIAGNVLFFFLSFVVLSTVGVLYSCCCGLQLVNGVKRVALPSSLIVPWLLTLPTTVMALVRVINDASHLTSIVSLWIAVGVVHCLSFFAVLGFAWRVAVAHFELRRTELPIDSRGNGVFRNVLPTAMHMCLHRMFSWQEKKECSAAGGLGCTTKRRWVLFLLEDHRFSWFPVVDALFLFIGSVLAGVGGLSKSQARVCESVAVTMAVLYALQLAVYAVLWPFTSTFAHAATVTSLCLVLASCVFQTIFVFLSSEGSPPPWLFVVSVACDLMLAAVTLLRFVVVDAADLVTGIRCLVLDIAIGCGERQREVPLATHVAVDETCDRERTASLTPNSNNSLQEEDISHLHCSFEQTLGPVPLNVNHEPSLLLMQLDGDTDAFGGAVVDDLRLYYCANELYPPV